ncbi:MAG TPA: hypothetical protein VK142_12130 [Bacillota bacterium]|nr:hypothetical protein [Bacillota bacterium]
MKSLHSMISGTQRKLGRPLKKEEIEFLKWMIQEQKEVDRTLQHN